MVWKNVKTGPARELTYNLANKSINQSIIFIFTQIEDITLHGESIVLLLNITFQAHPLRNNWMHQM